MSTKITDLRGSKVTPIHRGSVLLSKQEDLCSTSYNSSTSHSPLGILLLYELLLFELYLAINNSSTSHFLKSDS